MAERDNSTQARDFIPYLRQAGRRLRLRDGLELAARSAWLPLVAACALLALARLLPLPHYDLWAWSLPAAWLCALSLYTLLRRQAMDRVARRVDRELGLHERLSTALALEGGPAGFDAGLVARQREDAFAAASRIEPGRDLPVRWPRRLLAAAGAALALALALTLLPNPMDAVLRERAEVARTAIEEAGRLEKVAQTLQKSDALDPAEKEELLKQLREMAARLRANRGDREAALKDLAELQSSLRERLDPQATSRSATLEGLAAQMSALAQRPSEQPSLAEAAAMLEQLATAAGQNSPEERERLAQALEEAASRLGEADASLAQALRSTAAAAQRGDARGAAASAASAAEALNGAQRDLDAQEALGQALAAAQAGTRRVASAGLPASEQARAGNQAAAGTPAAQAGQSGQGGQPGQGGQGNQAGQAGGSGQQAGGGGGTTANQLPGAVRTGRAADPTKPNKDYGVDSTVYAPTGELPESTQGKPDFIPGQQGTGGETQTHEGESTQPGTLGPGLVPYQQVYKTYADQAAVAMEREYVPLNLRDYVREYFSKLEP